MKDAPPSRFAFFLAFFGFSQDRCDVSQIETHYIYDVGERIFLALSIGGISPLRGTQEYIYAPLGPSGWRE